jgi:hypothetical protein
VIDSDDHRGIDAMAAKRPSRAGTYIALWAAGAVLLGALWGFIFWLFQNIPLSP